MPRTTNYGWFLPDWEISSGQNAALGIIDVELASLSGTSSSQGSTLGGFVTDVSNLTDTVNADSSSITGFNTALTAHETTLGAGGTVDVPNLTITSANTILYCRHTAAGTTLGNLSYYIIDNTQITFTSDSVNDLSTIVYIIL